jgi:hypothetical protein
MIKRNAYGELCFPVTIRDGARSITTAMTFSNFIGSDAFDRNGRLIVNFDGLIEDKNNIIDPNELQVHRDTLKKEWKDQITKNNLDYTENYIGISIYKKKDRGLENLHSVALFVRENLMEKEPPKVEKKTWFKRFFSHEKKAA